MAWTWIFLILTLFLQSGQGSLMIPTTEEEGKMVRLIFTSIGDLILDPRSTEEIDAACANLAEIARRYGDDGIEKITELEGIWPLLQVLKKQHASDTAKKTAIVALSWLARGRPLNADLIAKYDGVALILHYMRTPGGDFTKWGIQALTTIAVDRPNITWIIAEEGGIPTIVKVLNTGTTEEKTKALSAVSTFSRSNVSDIIVLSGGARALAATLKQGTEAQVLKAVTALGNLAKSSSENAGAVADTGVIELIATLAARGSDQVRNAALLTLAMLAQRNARNRQLVAKAGAIKHMVDALRQGSSVHELNAILALSSAVTESPENQKVAVEAGAIEPLLKSADDSSEHKVPAALALAHIAVNNEDNLVAISAVGSISHKVALKGVDLAIRYFGLTNLTGSLVESLAQLGGIQVELAVPDGIKIGGHEASEVEAIKECDGEQALSNS